FSNPIVLNPPGSLVCRRNHSLPLIRRHPAPHRTDRNRRCRQVHDLCRIISGATEAKIVSTVRYHKSHTSPEPSSPISVLIFDLNQVSDFSSDFRPPLNRRSPHTSSRCGWRTRGVGNPIFWGSNSLSYMFDSSCNCSFCLSTLKMSKVDEGVSSELNDENQQRKEKVYLSSRCGVQEFSGLIDSLSDDKKHVIEDMGFGGLLHLKKHKLKLKLCEELMMRFDVTTSQLNVHGNRLTLRVDDVVTILGLHGGGMNVDTHLGEGDEVRVRFNLGYGQIKCSNLKTDMMKDLTVGDEFRGKFLLYSMSRLLRPSTAVYVPNNYLRILGNIDDVGNLNWAKFVYDGLLEGIKDYQNKLEGTSREQSVTGCILLLEIFYLEHVNMHNVTRHSSSLPRIRHWDDKSIGTIVKKVSSLGGVDSIQVEFGRDGASCFTIEDVTAQIVQLRNEFQQEMHSTKSQIGDLKKEMSDSMSQIITKLSSIESHLEAKAANKTIEDEAVQVRTKKGELNDDAIAHEKTCEGVRTGADHTISEENMTTNEDSTNVYDKLDNMARDFKAKEDFVELSDDASSLLKASTPKGNHLEKQGNRRSGAISSQNEKKRKANQHEEDETDSFEALMAGVDQKIRSREDSNMGLRKKEVLKAGPQFQFPYVADKPAVRGRGRQQGPKHQGTKKGGRSKKKIDDDWENKFKIKEIDIDPVTALPNPVENLWTFLLTEKFRNSTPSTTLVEFETYTATREELWSLRDGEHVQSGVINLVVAGLTLEYRDNKESD
ncbi:unnamed protein product, partial [Linum tenue]